MSASLPPDKSLLTGPLLLGWLMQWGLFGISTVQLYIYYMSFEKDHRALRGLVYGIYIIAMLLTALNTQYAVHVVGSGWGNPTVLLHPIWTFTSTSGITGLVSFAVQVFFSWRIYVLGRSAFLPVIYSAIGLASFVLATITGIKVQILDDMTRLSTLRGWVIGWLAGGAACDVAITVTLVFYLTQQRDGVLQQTQDTVTRLVRLTVETGLVTAIAALVELALYLAAPETNLHLAVFLVLAGLYTNALLASLNARSPLLSERQWNDAGQRPLGSTSGSVSLEFARSQLRGRGRRGRGSATLADDMETVTETVGAPDGRGDSLELESMKRER